MPDFSPKQEIILFFLNFTIFIDLAHVFHAFRILNNILNYNVFLKNN